jgi:hypothetical protein
VGYKQIPHQSEKVLRLVRIKGHFGEWHSSMHTNATGCDFTLQMQEMADE